MSRTGAFEGALEGFDLAAELFSFANERVLALAEDCLKPLDLIARGSHVVRQAGAIGAGLAELGLPFLERER
jgi:hypothetical protein